MENQKHTARPLSSTSGPADPAPDPAPDPASAAPSNVPVVTGPADDALAGFAPAVRKRERRDGWTPERQREFIETLADTGSVSTAARMVGMSESGAYQLRRSLQGQAFAYAWERAVHQASRRLADIAFERAVNGVEEPVFDKDGQCRYIRRKYNDRLLMFLLRSHNPTQYGLGDERIVSQKRRKEAKHWNNGYTPLIAALEVIHPAIDDSFGANMEEDIEDGHEAGHYDDENQETAEN